VRRKRPHSVLVLLVLLLPTASRLLGRKLEKTLEQTWFGFKVQGEFRA